MSVPPRTSSSARSPARTYASYTTAAGYAPQYAPKTAAGYSPYASTAASYSPYASTAAGYAPYPGKTSMSTAAPYPSYAAAPRAQAAPAPRAQTASSYYNSPAAYTRSNFGVHGYDDDDCGDCGDYGARSMQPVRAQSMRAMSPPRAMSPGRATYAAFPSPVYGQGRGY